jgi:hypothetical protein
LATVAITVYEFTARHPEKIVFISGTSPERTRLYRMTLTKNWEKLNLDFEIFGAILQRELYFTESFLKDKEYSAFAVKRKNHILGIRSGE